MPSDAPLPPALNALTKRFSRLSAMEDAQAFLQWDMAAVMPDGGAETRSTQMATLTGLHHELLTAPEVADWIAGAGEEMKTLGDHPDAPWLAANLREIKRTHAHATALPGDLVEALSRASNACERVWRKARPANDFAAVKAPLAALLSLVRQSAQAKSEALGVDLYDALLDEYEPGGSSARVDAIFGDLETVLPGVLQEVLDRQGPAPEIPQGPFPVDRQRELGRRAMETLGFDFNHGRLDVSAHPFCGGSPRDVRLTTRYDEADFTKALMGVIHETGHALYEQGLPEVWLDQPVGRARGMSVHESQSLLHEMQACRSAAFIAYATPVWKEVLGGSGPAWEVENLQRLYTRVNRGFIRVDADEVTYPAHVILRYRLEKDLIEGKMEVDHIPEAWNAAMERLLGVTPPTDTVGCLQDIHWYDGAWGYFPTYTLGAMTAAQLFDAARTQVPELMDAIGKGDFTPLLGWLRENVHHKGCLLTTDELLTQATGRPLEAAVFERHLRQRYLGEG
ncbi:MAG: carboxypeptidase M32 [Rhodospirillum sp.]|nr:carboxypeptidase M32 [Rhodospirillum sp.]MCF8491721.1 carboxypeptidase M32 [Rhodospirillum sp.]MCF8499458.1 carboxypeptidase M32 [Rhodospirillum sp.]